MKRRIILCLFSFLLIILICGCNNNPTLSFKEEEISIEVGEVFTLTPIKSDLDVEYTIKYEFSKEGILEYQSENTFKAISEGVVTIKAFLKEYEEVNVSIKVTVKIKEIEKYTVTFIGFNNEILTEKVAEKGSLVEAPNAPEVEGYTFVGWDKTFDNITSDLEVKAIYEEIIITKYTVTFIGFNNEVLSEVVVEEGSSVQAPNIPNIEGYEFIGWDKEFNSITSDLEVKSIYKEIILVEEIQLQSEFNVFIITIGESIKIDWKVLPSNALQDINVYSSNNKVASISEDGTIVGVSKGTTNIIFEAKDDSNVKTEIEINVVVETKPDYEKPKLTCDNKNVKLNWNEEFDPLDGVSAIDNVDGDLTKRIKVTNEVDNRTYGKYEVKYEVSDRAGNTATMTRYVEVVWDYAVEFIGHAGCYYGLQNSEEAILYAITKLKYQCVEVDLKSTKDGVFVLSHDDTFGDYTIASTNWSVLKDVEVSKTRAAGYPFQNGEAPGDGKYTAKLCTLDRFLDICKQYGVTAVIELKGSPGISNSDQSKMPSLMTTIKNKDMLDNVIFLASAYNCLIWTRQNGYEDIPCQYLVSTLENESYLKRCIDYDLDISTNTTYGGANGDDWIARYKEAGIKISTYTYTQYVNYDEVQKWIDKGVDYVTCDWHSMDKLKLPIKVDESLLPTYTVIFKDYDGSILKTIDVKEGKTPVAPTIDTREGYEFKGWDKSYSNVKSDLIVNATYNKINYTITYVDTLSKITVEEWSSKEAFGKEFYNDFYNWLLTRVGKIDGLTKNGNTLTLTKNNQTAAFSSGDEILEIDKYVFEVTLSNYIYKPVTRDSNGNCEIVPSEDYFLNCNDYREKYKEVDAMLYRGIKNRYTAYDDTYTPTPIGKIQIFFRFHQWLQGDAVIDQFLPLPKKYIVTNSGVDVKMPTTPNYYDIESEITLPTPTSSFEFLGWYSTSDFTGDPIIKITKGSTGNLVLYAKWGNK